MTSNELAIIPALGSIEAYTSAVLRYPMLTLEEEQSHGRKVRDEDDQTSAAALVVSHLKLVSSIARKYKAYGLPEEDIIQEGNIGLMKAVKRFDPDQGFRLTTYAIHWIRAEIHEYVIKNYHIAKIATTKNQRKLFFNLRTMKHKLHAVSGTDTQTLTPAEVKFIAVELDVKPTEVTEMERRFTNYTASLDNDDDDGTERAAWDVADETYEPTRVIENFEEEQRFARIEEELEKLSERERDIINHRWLAPMLGEAKVSLRELGEKHGISLERVRQIEENALGRVRKVMLSVEV